MVIYQDVLYILDFFKRKTDHSVEFLTKSGVSDIWRIFLSGGFDWLKKQTSFRINIHPHIINFDVLRHQGKLSKSYALRPLETI